MATTTDCTSLAQFAGTNAPYGRGSFGVVKLHVDIPSIISAKSITLDGSASDVLQVWDIPVGCCIMKVMIDVTTAEGATCTVDIGDGGDPDGYLDGGNINAVAKVAGAYNVGYAAGLCYAATDTLDITFTDEATVANAIFDVYVYAFFNEI